MAAKQRLTKGRIKARQRKMHQIAKLLELPGSVGPSCPSPPTNNLSSMRDSHSSGSSSPRLRPGAAERRPTGGSYRPLFNASSKVPGAAALLREASSTGTSARSKRQTNRQDDSGDQNTTTEEDEEVGIEAVESEMKALESNPEEAEETTEGFEERHSVHEDGEAIAMERFDQSEDYSELPSEDTLFDETSLKE